MHSYSVAAGLCGAQRLDCTLGPSSYQGAVDLMAPSGAAVPYILPMGRARCGHITRADGAGASAMVFHISQTVQHHVRSLDFLV